MYAGVRFIGPALLALVVAAPAGAQDSYQSDKYAFSIELPAPWRRGSEVTARAQLPSSIMADVEVAFQAEGGSWGAGAWAIVCVSPYAAYIGSTPADADLITVFRERGPEEAQSWQPDEDRQIDRTFTANNRAHHVHLDLVKKRMLDFEHAQDPHRIEDVGTFIAYGRDCSVIIYVSAINAPPDQIQAQIQGIFDSFHFTAGKDYNPPQPDATNHRLIFGVLAALVVGFFTYRRIQNRAPPPKRRYR